jgi:hypothetical protein
MFPIIYLGTTGCTSISENKHWHNGKIKYSGKPILGTILFISEQEQAPVT